MPGELEEKWLVNLNGSAEEVQELMEELSADDVLLIRDGDSYYLEDASLSNSNSDVIDEWGVAGLVDLMNASAHLRLGPYQRIHLVPGLIALEDSIGGLPSTSQILRVARERELFRKALCSFRAGGPDGLFEAYDALSYELIRSGVSDYERDMGTKEWIVERGWATSFEIDRFLETVLNLRQGHQAPASAMPPQEAAALMRRLLLNFTLYCFSKTSEA